MVDNYLDPDEKPVAEDTRSSDASKGGVQRVWDEFSKSPENRAALLQFGLNMMSPQPKGQTFAGSVANAVGGGAEAATGNIAAQEAEAERASKQEERASQAQYRQAQSEAVIRNAGAYERQVSAMGGGREGRNALQTRMLAQRSFNSWLNKPTDLTGLSEDSVLKAIQQKFPEVKSKADLVNNPILAKRVLDMYQGVFAGDNTEPSTPPASAQPPQPGAAAPVPPPSNRRTFYDQSTGVPREFEWNGTQWVPIQ